LEPSKDGLALSRPGWKKGGVGFNPIAFYPYEALANFMRAFSLHIAIYLLLTKFFCKPVDHG